MSPLICIPAVAVLLLMLLWAVLKPRVSFDAFPIPEYREKLEFAVFFLPAGLAGWLSILLAHSYLSADGSEFNLAWPHRLTVAFIMGELVGVLALALAGDSSKAVQKVEPRDFIAMGFGYIVGVLVGTYDIIVHKPQPPRILSSLGGEANELILIILGAIAWISLDAYLVPYLRKRRKKGKRRKGNTSRKKQLTISEEKAADALPSSTENQVDMDENPSG